MKKACNSLFPQAGRQSIVAAAYRQTMKSLLIPLVCVAVMSIPLVAQPKNDTQDTSAVFTFATPCNDDTESECLYFQWPTMFGGAARVAIPFTSRPVATNQSQVSTRVEHEVGQLSNLAYQHTCIEFMGEFCR